MVMIGGSSDPVTTGHGVVMAKQLSANQLPQTIQISQEVNPMNLQHLSSIDRTVSIDSASYEINSLHLAAAKTGVPVSAQGLTPTNVHPGAGRAYETINSSTTNANKPAQPVN